MKGRNPSNKKARQLNLDQRLLSLRSQCLAGEILIAKILLRAGINFTSVCMDRWHRLPHSQS